MKFKNTPTNDRTSTGLYKGTPLVCAIHKYLEAIWTITIIAIAITICLSINPKDGFIFSFLGACIIIVLATLCLIAIAITALHKQRLEVVRILSFIRNGMRSYGYGDADGLFYTVPRTKEDWITILRDSNEYANAHYHADIDDEENNFLNYVIRVSRILLHKEHLL